MIGQGRWIACDIVLVWSAVVRGDAWEALCLRISEDGTGCSVFSVECMVVG